MSSNNNNVSTTTVPGFRSVLECHYGTLKINAPLSKDECSAAGMTTADYKRYASDCKALLVALGDYIAECKNDTNTNADIGFPANIHPLYKQVLGYLTLGESDTRLKVGKNDFISVLSFATGCGKNTDTGERTFRKELEKFIVHRLNGEKVPTRTEIEAAKAARRAQQAAERKSKKEAEAAVKAAEQPAT